MDIYVNEIKFENDELKCYVEEDFSDKTLVSMEQMIVDSDNFTIIYILDDGEEFIRTHFVSETWEMLERYRNSKIVLNDQVELEDFYTHLEELLENIEGNNNYGKEFEGKIVETFTI